MSTRLFEDGVAPKPRRRPLVDFFRRSQGALILLAMIVGIIVGLVVGEPAKALEPIGQVFVRLLLAAAIPLVMANLLSGITGLSNIGLMGRVGGRFCLFFVISTFVAIALGIGFTELYGPGNNVAPLSASARDAVAAGKVPGLGDFLFNLVPDNIIAAFAEERVPQIIVFAFLLGTAVLFSPPDVRRTFHRGATVLDAVLRQLVSLIMLAAPIGIGALAASAAGQFGTQMLRPLALFIGAVWSAQLMVCVLMLLALALFTRRSPAGFIRETMPLYATAAATCSSLASLAVAVRIAEERLRLPRAVYSLTLPLGSQLSKEGTAAMLGAALIFTAQAAGVHFSLSDYSTILIVGLFLAGASGGIPGGGLVKVLLIVEAFHLPLEIAAIIGGIYRLLDIGNTTVNVLGDMVGTQIVAASRGVWHEEERAPNGDEQMAQ